MSNPCFIIGIIRKSLKRLNLDVKTLAEGVAEHRWIGFIVFKNQTTLTNKFINCKTTDSVGTINSVTMCRVGVLIIGGCSDLKNKCVFCLFFFFFFFCPPLWLFLEKKSVKLKSNYDRPIDFNVWSNLFQCTSSFR